MATDPLPAKPAAGRPPEAPPPRPSDFLAALLSYLVPGLGQIYQGRVGKGVLFMGALLGMFFLGMYLGSGSNVYLPQRKARVPGNLLDSLVERFHLPEWVTAVGNDRLAFAGQFWIGAAAWPAILQYNEKWPVASKPGSFWGDFQRTPSERMLNELQAAGNKTWDLGWVYTVIAGVLNILVIYDAFAGPAFVAASAKAREEVAAPASAPQEAAAV
jgi:hypothetical protein